MANKLILLLLSIYLLVQIPQCTQAKAVVAKDEEFDPRKTMFIAIFAELTELSRYTITESKPIITKVINEIRVKPEKSAKMQEYLKKFNDYFDDVVKYEKHDDDLEELMKVFVEFTALTEIFDEDKNEHIDADQLFIKQSLEKNGIEQMGDDVEKRFETFAKVLIEAVEKFETTLSAQELEKESKFFDWFKKFKTAKGEAQFETMTEFLDSYIAKEV